MDESNEIIISLKDKLQSIISLYEDSKGRLQELEHENEDLKTRIKTQDEELVQLETKNKSINISKALLTSSDEANDAKMKVNKIVREIDKCIALLNR